MMERREFLKTAVLSTAALAVNRVLPGAETAEHLQAASSSNAPALLKRSYGKTGIQLSIIGFSGLMLQRIDQNASNRIVAESVERGVNYFDVAPAYGDAEIKLGPALEPYRKNVFLAAKTYQRTAEGMEKELKRSLERLKTDHLDLYQMHNIASVEKHVDVAFAKGGAMETMIQAKKEGRVRHLGFSAHTVEAALAALDRYEFDSLIFPFNFASYLKAGFGPQVMEKAQARGTARIAIKACIRGRWRSEDERKRSEYGWIWYEPLVSRHDAALGLRFTLSQPITTAMPPMDVGLYRQALDIAMEFKPISAEEEKEIKAMAEATDPLFPERKS